MAAPGGLHTGLLLWAGTPWGGGGGRTTTGCGGPLEAGVEVAAPGGRHARRWGLAGGWGLACGWGLAGGWGLAPLWGLTGILNGEGGGDRLTGGDGVLGGRWTTIIPSGGAGLTGCRLMGRTMAIGRFFKTKKIYTY